MDTAGEFLFHTNDINSLDMPLPNPRNSRTKSRNPEPASSNGIYQQFSNAVRGAQLNIVKRRNSGFKWYFREFFKDSQAEHVHAINQWIGPLVDQAIKRELTRQQVAGPLPLDDPENATFIDHLVTSCDQPSVARDQLFNILHAARDTTSTLLTFTAYLLSLHPDVTEKLRAEVLEMCGDNEAPTHTILRGMRYCTLWLPAVLGL